MMQIRLLVLVTMLAVVGITVLIAEAVTLAEARDQISGHETVAVSKFDAYAMS